MSVKEIQRSLERALLEDGDMEFDLYHDELAPHLENLRESLEADKDEFTFMVTSDGTTMAMVLMEASGATYINDKARTRLKELWPLAYESNMKMFIPDFAEELDRGEISITGVKTVE